MLEMYRKFLFVVFLIKLGLLVDPLIQRYTSPDVLLVTKVIKLEALQGAPNTNMKTASRYFSVINRTAADP